MKGQIFYYVPNGSVPGFLSCGWIAHNSLENTHHGEFSTLMEWAGEGEPRMPKAWDSDHASSDD